MTGPLTHDNLPPCTCGPRHTCWGCKMAHRLGRTKGGR